MKPNFKGFQSAILYLAVVLALLYPNSLFADSHKNAGLTPDEKNNIEIFNKTNKSVVYVTNSQMRRDRFNMNIYEIPAGTGTGFVWNRDGLIVTNHHVIANATKITITLWNQSSWDAEVIGRAPYKDLAVLKIKAPASALFPIQTGNSDLLDVGRKVLAIGNPFGLDTTLTVGVVSALGREIPVEGRKIKGLIQTDAAINPGNSGGPLLNSKGELVGVNTLIYGAAGSIGVGFALPVNTVKTIIPQLIEHGRVMRPIIGIHPMPEAFNRRYGIKGVVIAEIPEDSPAEKAGLLGMQRDRRGNVRLGDVIIKADDTEIKNLDDLFTFLENHHIGDLVRLETMRGKSKKIFRIKLSSPE